VCGYIYLLILGRGSFYCFILTCLKFTISVPHIHTFVCTLCCHNENNWTGILQSDEFLTTSIEQTCNVCHTACKQIIASPSISIKSTSESYKWLLLSWAHPLVVHLMFASREEITLWKIVTIPWMDVSKWKFYLLELRWQHSDNWHQRHAYQNHLQVFNRKQLGFVSFSKHSRHDVKYIDKSYLHILFVQFEHSLVSYLDK
jgi:hypothetical protein